jgi:DNA-binding transcriptional LysR family regulator
MARDRFATLDLNLLRTLSVLTQERNTRRAAERLFVTQPAVSQALKKLRHHFDDELFVRSASGLQATRFTEQLMDRVAPLLDELSDALNQGQDFDPANIDRPLRIALAPHMASFLSAKLFRAIRQAAPQANVYLDAWNVETLASLSKDDFLLGVNVPIEERPADITAHTLADDRFTGYVRVGHPVLGRRRSITLQDLDGVEIAALVVADFNERETLIERLLRSNGLRARVGFRSAFHAAVTEVLRSTDMVYGASSFIDAAHLQGLRALDVKVNDRFLNYPATAYFHRKNAKNPLVGWLLSLLRNLLVR